MCYLAGMNKWLISHKNGAYNVKSSAFGKPECDRWFTVDHGTGDCTLTNVLTWIMSEARYGDLIVMPDGNTCAIYQNAAAA